MSDKTVKESERRAARAALAERASGRNRYRDKKRELRDADRKKCVARIAGKSYRRLRFGA